jgi:uncharacterized protein YdaL
MKIRVIAASVLASLGVLSGSATVQAQVPAPRALILYDAPAGLYNKFGLATSIMLRNLLGHFDTSAIAMQPVETYSAGAMGNYDVVFYLGTSYDNAIPSAFLADVDTNLKSALPKTVVWFKYNIWKLAWDGNYTFTQSSGISFNGLQGFNSTPSNSNQNPGFYDTVSYKGESMLKYYAYDPATGTAAADPDVGATSVAAPAQSLVTISNSKNSAMPALPYVVRSNNFWYFADVPLSYIGPRDRYLAFADLLHDIMGQDHPVKHTALVRLEDVSADVNTASMKKLTRYMFERPVPIPFAIAAIPRYRDPYGAYNGGVAEDIPLSMATNLKTALTYAKTRGGQYVQHGWTHQSDGPVNNINGVSGEDYEFWNMTANTPMAAENGTQSWSNTRMQNGLKELKNAGFIPFAWEAPHYQSSPLSIKSNMAIPGYNGKVFGRVVYYTSETPDLKGVSGVYDYSPGQFYPYVIKKDYYGQYVIPENLGNIERKAVCSYCYDYLPSDLVLNARYALVVRDGFASFFFHPYLLNPETTALGIDGMADFSNTMTGISNLGYTWGSPQNQ